MDARIARKRLNELLLEHELACRQVEVERENLAQVRQQLADINEAQNLIQIVAQQVQNKAHICIADVVSRCLADVFPNPYRLNISFERKRGRTEAKLTFVRDGYEYDPMTATSGGVKAVAALALRLASLVRTKPPTRRLLVLDEPFVHVSEQYMNLIPTLLESLAEEMSLQIVMATNIPALECGKVIRLG